jgi:hypothetical protein
MEGVVFLKQKKGNTDIERIGIVIRTERGRRRIRDGDKDGGG